MPKNDPEYSNRKWAKSWGGYFISPSKRESTVHIFDHPLWNVRRYRDTELFDRMQNVYRNLKKPFQGDDKMFILDITKHGGVAASSLVVMKFTDFQDLAVGSPSGEVERESSGGPLDWAMIARGWYDAEDIEDE